MPNARTRSYARQAHTPSVWASQGVTASESATLSRALGSGCTPRNETEGILFSFEMRGIHGCPTLVGFDCTATCRAVNARQRHEDHYLLIHAICRRRRARFLAPFRNASAVAKTGIWAAHPGGDYILGIPPPSCSTTEGREIPSFCWTTRMEANGRSPYLEPAQDSLQIATNSSHNLVVVIAPALRLSSRARSKERWGCQAEQGVDGVTWSQLTKTHPVPPLPLDLDSEPEIVQLSTCARYSALRPLVWDLLHRFASWGNAGPEVPGRGSDA
ncbi:hypothetical protein BKA70DRAFT_1401113 [Coprinopsis sp. MPI-PUGE-AT-0042]|nr:hypothetical protein BKA70DRAFT_1401113 [Coprinopsis sp. MPI-PUGE-AT-0042]